MRITILHYVKYNIFMGTSKQYFMGDTHNDFTREYPFFSKSSAEKVLLYNIILQALIFVQKNAYIL